MLWATSMSKGEHRQWRRPDQDQFLCYGHWAQGKGNAGNGDVLIKMDCCVMSAHQVWMEIQIQEPYYSRIRPWRYGYIQLTTRHDTVRHLHGYTPGYQWSYPDPYPPYTHTHIVGMGISGGYVRVPCGLANPWVYPMGLAYLILKRKVWLLNLYF